ncbi:MAG TPA: cyclic nucleotide-binding domain-containing protein [Methyloceanibacter sp.]
MDWVNLLGYAAAASVLAKFCNDDSSTHPRSRQQRAVLHLRLFRQSLSRADPPPHPFSGESLPADSVSASRPRAPHGPSIGSFHRELVAAYEAAHEGWRNAHSPGRQGRQHLLFARRSARVLELGKTLDPGAVVGEIGVFASDAKRTATIVCRTDCRIYELSENQAKQLFLQDRKFGFAMMRLVIDRLLENNRRLLETASREAELSAGR